MAELYGGEARTFTSQRGKTYWGWFLDLEDRLAILNGLEDAGAFLALRQDDVSAIRAKLERSLNSRANRS